MKFYCDNCQTKYSIADEKVRGKVLKVRCKKCSHVITVREPGAPAASQQSASRKSAGTSQRGASSPTGSAPEPPTPPQKQVEWYYSVNGQSFGPLDQSELAAKFAGGELGDATYIWNETFSDWKPVKSVAAFSDALKQARDIRPSKNTVGVSEAMEAVERSDQAPKTGDKTQATSTPQKQGEPEKTDFASQKQGESEKTDFAPQKQGEPEKTDSARDPDSEQALVSDSSPRVDSDPHESSGERPDDGKERMPEQEQPAKAKERSTKKKPSSVDESSKESASRKGRLDNLRQRLGVTGTAKEEEKAAEVEETTDAPEGESKLQADDDLPQHRGGEDSEQSPQPDDGGGGVEALRKKIGAQEEDDLREASDQIDESTEEQSVLSGSDDDEETFEDESGESFGPDVDASPEEQEDAERSADATENFGFAETLPDSTASDDSSKEDDVASGSGVASEMTEDAVHDGLFSGMDDGSAAAPAPEDLGPTSESSTEEQDEEAEDAVPFFPSAPKLGDSKDESDESTSMSRVGEITDSLLIQIDEIKSDGRKRAVLGTLGVLAALATLGVVGYFAWMEMDTDEVIEEDDGIQMGNVGQRPEFQTYTQEELAEVSDRVVMRDELVISREDSKAAYEREESGDDGGQDTGESSGDESAMARVNPDAFERVDDSSEPAAEAGAGDSEGAGVSGSRFGRPSMGDGQASAGGDMAALEDLDDADVESRDRFEAMAAVQSDRERRVYDGDENVNLDDMEMQEGLTGNQIANGMQTLMESVGSCRERHIYRGGSFDVDQIQISLTVLPDGEIGQFSMEPSSLDDTDFKRCMDSHTGRWRFPRFLGDPVEIQAPFALQ